MIYTEQQIQEIKALRLEYISKMIDADTYELSMAQINSQATQTKAA